MFLPFHTTMTEKEESLQVNLTPNSKPGVLVNVGWISMKQYNRSGLKGMKLPDQGKINLVVKKSGRTY